MKGSTAKTNGEDERGKGEGLVAYEILAPLSWTTQRRTEHNRGRRGAFGFEGSPI